jgi:hypothetical protein
VLLGSLDDVAARSRAQGLHDGVVVLEHRHRDDADVGSGGGEAACGFDAGHAGHRYVHQRDVGLKLKHGAHARGSVAREAADFDVLDRGEEVLHPLAEDGVVVDDEDADHWVCAVAHGNRTSTASPPLGPVASSTRPPSSAARSRIERSPTPGAASLARPCPSSVIASATSSPSVRRPMRSGSDGGFPLHRHRLALSAAGARVVPRIAYVRCSPALVSSVPTSRPPTPSTISAAEIEL